MEAFVWSLILQCAFSDLFVQRLFLSAAKMDVVWDTKPLSANKSNSNLKPQMDVKNEDFLT